METKVVSTNSSGLDPFKIELYFAKYEFNTRYLLCCSDAETMDMKDLLCLADEECQQMWEKLSLGYTECWGMPQLRAECASQFYPGLAADNIRMFSGAEEGIYCAMTAMLSPADHAIVISPCYQSLYSLPKSRCQTSTIELDPSNEWHLDLDILRSTILPNTKVVIMNWPHNPTGYVPQYSELQSIITLAREHDLWIFSDEVYRGLEFDEANRLPTVASIYEKGLSLGVVSKSLGLAGLRVGWIAGQDQKMLNEIADIKHYLSICNSGPSEILALIALRNKEHILNRINDITYSNLQLIDQFLERWDSKFRWTRPLGGCCGFMEFFDDSITVDQLAHTLVEDFGVLIIPGSTFITSKNDTYKAFFRIGFGRRNFPECLAAFESAVTTVVSQSK